jgi:hypothetical protein
LPILIGSGEEEEQAVRKADKKIIKTVAETMFLGWFFLEPIISTNVQMTSNTADDIKMKPPTSGKEKALKLSNCLYPIKGGW